MDLKETAKIEEEIKTRKAGVGEYGSMYVYGTEYISEYYSRLDLKNRKVLAIAGSGDQVINAYSFGAKEAVGFDINKFSCFLNELKWKAIEGLNYSEFLEFFGQEYEKASFSHKIYYKFREKLDSKTLDFFESLFEYFDFNGTKLGQSCFFHHRELIVPPTEINEYLKTEKNYNKVRKILAAKKLEFVHANITTLGANEKIKGKEFDVINLSNIPQYVIYNWRKEGIEEPEKRFFKEVLLALKEKLSTEGIIFFYVHTQENRNPCSLQYCPDSCKVPLINIDEQLKLLKQRKEFEYSEMEFKGVFKGKDRIIMLKNKN